MINSDKEKTGLDIHPTIVDLHPSRPDYRGFLGPLGPISLEADPSFAEVEAAGGVVSKNDKPHTVLDNCFLVSGFIPRVTEYEQGLKRGLRWVGAKGEWEEDTLVADERLVMCKVKDRGIVMFTGCSHAGVVNASKHAVELGGGTALYAVVGGYHLADAEKPAMEATIRDLKALDPKVLVQWVEDQDDD
jgi:7,8-dihydropterin-6-yl-methyl-4-(beta-D-ribofuranosyl)aminobenzene 5'-phosphate synthase